MTTPQRLTPVQVGPADRPEVFAHVVAGVRAGQLPVPLQVTFEPALGCRPYVCLHLEPGDRVGVDRWAAHFGLPRGGLAPYVLALPDVPAYRMYEAESDGPLVERPGPDGVPVLERDYLAPPLLWHGWNVHVACRVGADDPLVLAAEAAGPALDDTAVIPVCETVAPVSAVRVGPVVEPLPV